MTDEERAAAGLERSRGVATRADRPSQRRCAEITSAPASVRSKAKLTLTRAASGSGGDTVDFFGCASAYEAPFEMWDAYGPYTEIVTAGAGAQSLAQPDLDVPLVLQHDPLRRIARTTNGTLTVTEGPTDDEGGQGLLCAAPGLDMRDADVAYITPKIESGLIDEMSFAFTITSGQWDPTYTEYRINSFDIQRGDVSIVGYGANPATSAELRAVVKRLQVGRGLAAGDVTVLTDTLRASTLDEPIVDEAIRALSTYIEIREPDADDKRELAGLTLAALRDQERALFKELRTRHLEPALTLGALLAIAD